jgi:membrane-associated phospholipid phosphatase
VTLVAAAAVNLVWKLSLHAAMAAVVLASAALLLHPVALAASPLLALVAWARVRLAAHTPAQVAGGVVLGIAAAGMAVLVV